MVHTWLKTDDWGVKQHQLKESFFLRFTVANISGLLVWNSEHISNSIDCAYILWGSFQFSGPRKYSIAHVYWPKKQN